ncbi:hypothetical protein DFJ74DRAFT_770205 [Hyaloraphidium curvatum]|nr:hypothetical protein DFJ74DRAFT_770205 [Hyaloraphidium curvatum]
MVAADEERAKSARRAEQLAYAADVEPPRRRFAGPARWLAVAFAVAVAADFAWQAGPAWLGARGGWTEWTAGSASPVKRAALGGPALPAVPPPPPQRHPMAVLADQEDEAAPEIPAPRGPPQRGPLRMGGRRKGPGGRGKAVFVGGDGPPTGPRPRIADDWEGANAVDADIQKPVLKLPGGATAGRKLAMDGAGAPPLPKDEPGDSDDESAGAKPPSDDGEQVEVGKEMGSSKAKEESEEKAAEDKRADDDGQTKPPSAETKDDGVEAAPKNKGSGTSGTISQSSGSDLQSDKESEKPADGSKPVADPKEPKASVPRPDIPPEEHSKEHDPKEVAESMEAGEPKKAEQEGDSAPADSDQPSTKPAVTRLPPGTPTTDATAPPLPSCPPPPSSPLRNLTSDPIRLCMGTRGSRDAPEKYNCSVPWTFWDDCATSDVRVYEMLRHGSPPPFGSLDWACGRGATVGYTGESEGYYPDFVHGKEHGRFNISATYRFDSDIPQTYFDPPYYRLRQPPLPLSAKRTDAVMSAFVSNCGSRNGREAILANLTALLDGKLHSYGGCGHNADPPPELAGKSGWDVKMNLTAGYRFALVVENSEAKDYVTEKLYQVLTAGAVPVYYGDPEVLHKVPNRTGIVLLKSFPDLGALARRLEELMADDAAYERLLEWKKHPFQDTWVDLERMANVPWKCRVAMHVAGRTHRWRRAAAWGAQREVDESKEGVVYDAEAGEVCPMREELADGGGGARGGWGVCRGVVEAWDREHPPKEEPAQDVRPAADAGDGSDAGSGSITAPAERGSAVNQAARAGRDSGPAAGDSGSASALAKPRKRLRPQRARKGASASRAARRTGDEEAAPAPSESVDGAAMAAESPEARIVGKGKQGIEELADKPSDAEPVREPAQGVPPPSRILSKAKQRVPPLNPPTSGREEGAVGPTEVDPASGAPVTAARTGEKDKHVESLQKRTAGSDRGNGSGQVALDAGSEEGSQARELDPDDPEAPSRIVGKGKQGIKVHGEHEDAVGDVAAERDDGLPSSRIVGKGRRRSDAGFEEAGTKPKAASAEEAGGRPSRVVHKGKQGSDVSLEPDQ